MMKCIKCDLRDETQQITYNEYKTNYGLIDKKVTQLLKKAFQEAQKLSETLQDELGQKLLSDVENELKWQETLANPDSDWDALRQMAQAALNEEQEGKTEKKGFGEK